MERINIAEKFARYLDLLAVQLGHDLGLPLL
jgi:hypothetical protein